MTIKTTIIAIAAAAAFVAPLATASDAEAKRGGGKTYYETFDTRYAERGYEGFIGGKHGNYCSYYRKPNRRCFITRSGYERCKVVSWKLVQHCY